MSAVLERIHKRMLKQPDGCWEWQGHRLPRGYGQIRIGSVTDRSRRTLYVHRVMFEEVCGPIPEGHDVCHTCDNPPCCNPDHLFTGTRKENHADMIAKGRSAVGEKNSQAKLTWEQIEEIRNDTRLHREIAADYGIVRQHVSTIKSGQAWKKE